MMFGIRPDFWSGILGLLFAVNLGAALYAGQKKRPIAMAILAVVAGFMLTMFARRLMEIM